VDETLFPPQQLVQTDGQHAVGNHLAGGRAGVGAVKLSLSCAGAKQEFVAPYPLVAVENRLACDEHFHGLVSTKPRVCLGNLRSLAWFLPPQGSRQSRIFREAGSPGCARLKNAAFPNRYGR